MVIFADEITTTIKTKTVKYNVTNDEQKIKPNKSA